MVLADVLQSFVFEGTIDVFVFTNAIAIGFEVDNPDVWIFEVLRHSFCGIYILEHIIRIIFHGQNFFCKRLPLTEAIIVVLAILGAWVLPDIKILWRLSVWRCIRFLRYKEFARTCSPLHELWLVLMGLTRAVNALAWLAVLLGCTLYAGGSVARTLVVDELGDKVNFPCGGDDFRIHILCLDTGEYFGSIFRSWFTMLQLATLDRWASHVVRPMYALSPLTAVVLLLFVLCTTYALLSIAVGVLVWSTVDLASAHQDHHSRMEVKQDNELILTLREYFYNSLAIEDRTMMDFRELREALEVPGVKQAWKTLDLPVTDINQLWLHLDPMEYGEITLDEFERGCRKLKEPATRYDMACLAAKLNGNAVFSDRLGDRCEVVVRQMGSLCRILNSAFADIKVHVLSEEVNESMPEVGLRRAGFMSREHLFLKDQD